MVFYFHARRGKCIVQKRHPAAVTTTKPNQRTANMDSATVQKFLERAALLDSAEGFGRLTAFTKSCILTDFVLAVQCAAERPAAAGGAAATAANKTLCFVVERAASALVAMADQPWADVADKHTAFRCCTAMLATMSCWPTKVLEQSWSTASVVLSKIMTLHGSMRTWAALKADDTLQSLACTVRLLVTRCTVFDGEAAGPGTGPLPFARMAALALALRMAMETRTLCAVRDATMVAPVTMEAVIADGLEPAWLEVVLNRVDWRAAGAVDSNNASYVASQLLSAACAAFLNGTRDAGWLVAVTRVVVPRLDVALRQIVSAEVFSANAVTALQETLKNAAFVVTWVEHKDPSGRAGRLLAVEWAAVRWFFAELVTARSSYADVLDGKPGRCSFKNTEIVVGWLYVRTAGVVKPPRPCTAADLEHLRPGSKPSWTLDTCLDEQVELVDKARALLAVAPAGASC